MTTIETFNDWKERVVACSKSSKKGIENWLHNKYSRDWHLYDPYAVARDWDTFSDKYKEYFAK